MGRIDLFKLRQSESNHSNLAAHYKFVAGSEEIEGIYQVLKSLDFSTSRLTCYLYGFGSQPKSAYRNIKAAQADNYEVIWYGYDGPRSLKFLSYVTASTSGFIRIKQAGCIEFLMKRLSHLSMAGLFVLSQEFALGFEEYIISNTKDLKANPESFIKKDPGFFYFIIDGDTYDEQKDGFFCEAAFGKKCPAHLFDIVRFTGKRWG
jgi:hypothetical protein